ncbi:hypothetical protein ACIA4K_04035 [Lactobacillus delbrueckii subsp. bulgaricus]|uniref:hypothetical protein n=1 Tax=Lactobacillus delbrueckii TaxID=1584 RepID=UPI0038527086
MNNARGMNKIEYVSLTGILRQIYIFSFVTYVSLNLVYGGANFFGVMNIQTPIGFLTHMAYYLTIITSIANAILNYKYSLKKTVFVLIAGIVLFLMLINSNRSLIFFFLVIIGYPKDLELKKLSNYLYHAMIFGIIFVLVMHFLGFFKDVVFVQHSVLRHSLGFTAPNAMANYILLVFLLKVYTSWDDWHLKDTIVWLIIISTSYFFTNSRAAFFYGAASLISTALYRNGKFTKNMMAILNWLPTVSFTVLMMVTLYAILYFSKHSTYLETVINGLTTGRLGLMLSFYQDYGFSWFGHHIATISLAEVRASGGRLSWYGLDTSYAYIAINDGFLGLICYWFIFFFANVQVVKKKDWGGIILLSSLALIGLTENYLRQVTLNFMFFIFASYISSIRMPNIECN